MATFWMCHKIVIAGIEVRGITKVEIVKSVDALSGMAYIEFPASIQNKPFNIEKKWKRGDEVVVSLGYNNIYKEEFRGYIRSISANNPCTISCEDGIYLFRKQIAAKEFKKVSVDTILQYLCNQVKGFKLESSVTDLRYDKFVIRPHATGYDVLRKIQEQFGVKIYTKGNNVLVANLAFLERNGKVIYDYKKNVKLTNLNYVVEDDVRVEVIVRGVGKDNKVTPDISVGEKGGEIVKLPNQINVTSEGALRKIAEQRLAQMSYSGYRGDLTAWGWPFCGIGWTAYIKDPDYPDRDGGYFVKAVTVRFSISGYERQVSIGAKLN